MRLRRTSEATYGIANIRLVNGSRLAMYAELVIFFMGVFYYRLYAEILFYIALYSDSRFMMGDVFLFTIRVIIRWE